MAKCPECGAEIDYLRDFSKVWQEFRFAIDSEGMGQYEETANTVPDDVADDEYECPECNKVLFRNHNDAERFLKGGTPCP